MPLPLSFSKIPRETPLDIAFISVYTEAYDEHKVSMTAE